VSGARIPRRLRRRVARKRRIIIGQRLRQLVPAVPALVAEIALLDRLIGRAIDLAEWALFHAVVSLTLLLWAKWVGRRIRRNQLAWYLFVATAGLGPIGPFAALATGVLLIAFHRDWYDFQAWYSSLFPAETRSRVKDLYESLLRRQRQKTGTAVESFADILSGGDAVKKRLVIGLLTRHFRPGFAPALKQALSDADASVRTQAATAVASIEGRFLARAQILSRKARERPKSFGRRQRLARHYDEYAFTGLLDPERERDNRIRALESYEEALKVRPREPGLWLAIGRLLVRERRYDAAASWFTVAEARGLLNADMVLWYLEALFRTGRYDKLRAAVAEYRHLFQAGGKHPPQVPDVVGLWTAAPAATEAAG
jgi:tetratricopeptide (TPR) repeat protein